MSRAFSWGVGLPRAHLCGVLCPVVAAILGPHGVYPNRLNRRCGYWNEVVRFSDSPGVDYGRPSERRAPCSDRQFRSTPLAPVMHRAWKAFIFPIPCDSGHRLPRCTGRKGSNWLLGNNTHRRRERGPSLQHGHRSTCWRLDSDEPCKAWLQTWNLARS